MNEVCYEVRLTLEPAIGANFDAWLAGHIEAMLALPGFQRARLLNPEPGSDGRVQRIVRYQVESRQALDNYFQQHAARMRADGLKRFGDRFQAQRDIYPLDLTQTVPEERRCPNCNAVAEGEWCPACGQEQRDYHIAFHRLILDFLGDSFMFDSRVFRSLRFLLFKPGRVTRENLEGRRVRYIPALRLYLFSALIFFTLSSVLVDWNGGGLTSEAALGVNDAPADGAPEMVVEPDRFRSPVIVELDEDAPLWAKQLQKTFSLSEEDSGTFVRSWLSNMSLAMLVLVPVYALLLKLLYFRSGYYYLEHLIFGLHVHAFAFVAFSIMLLYHQFLGGVVFETLSNVISASAAIYIAAYTLLALRRVYRQTWAKTIAKYLLLGSVYLLLVVGSVTGVLAASVYFL